MLQRPDCFDGRTMEADGQDVRAEPLEERRRRLVRLLSRSNKALRDGNQLSEAITGDGVTIFRRACWIGSRRHRLEAHRLAVRSWPDAGMVEEPPKNPDFARRILLAPSVLLH